MRGGTLSGRAVTFTAPGLAAFLTGTGKPACTPARVRWRFFTPFFASANKAGNGGNGALPALGDSCSARSKGSLIAEASWLGSLPFGTAGLRSEGATGRLGLEHRPLLRSIELAEDAILILSTNMADRSESPQTAEESGGERPMGGSELPPGEASKAVQPSLVLQDTQLDFIVQKVVDRLQVPGPGHSDRSASRSGPKRQKVRVRPLSSSSDSEDSLGACWAKRAKGAKGKRPAVRAYRGRTSSTAGKRHKSAFSPDPWASTTPDSSDSSEEEGELSGMENEGAEMTKNRFFPMEFFPKLMGKAVQTLGLHPLTTDKPEGKEAQTESSKFFLSAASDKFPAVPLPSSFKQII